MTDDLRHVWRATWSWTACRHCIRTSRSPGVTSRIQRRTSRHRLAQRDRREWRAE